MVLLQASLLVVVLLPLASLPVVVVKVLVLMLVPVHGLVQFLCLCCCWGYVMLLGLLLVGAPVLQLLKGERYVLLVVGRGTKTVAEKCSASAIAAGPIAE